MRFAGAFTSLAVVEKPLQIESEKLAQSWMRHDPAMLRDYLVADVENPRINLQSILTRHFLIASIDGTSFRELVEAEWAFSAAMNWIFTTAKSAGDAESLAEIAHALRCGADNAEGIEIPRFLSLIYRSLPREVSGQTVPNYIESALRETRYCDGHAILPQTALETFEHLWNQAMNGFSHSPLTVLEPACGSANDYRFLVRYGIASSLAYTGVDICEKNIANARVLFPNVDFRTGNIFALDAPDRAFACSFVHDLFEHLSPAGIETGVKELCRVTQRELCVHFFNMDEIPDDFVRPLEEYHWNTLSMDRMRERFAAQGFSGQVLQIGAFLRSRLGCEQTHNPRAYTFLLRREQ